MHTALAIARNTIILVAKKVEDSVFRMMNAPVTVPQPAMQQDPVNNPLHALLKVPNVLIIN